MSNQTKQKTVLLVEDDKPTRLHLTKAINEHPKLTVSQSCGSFKQGLKALSDQQPDVLVTDLGLPDGSGIDLIRYARKHKQSIEIMVITVFGDERHILNAIEAGASSYLLKDGGTEYIGDAIMKLLAGESPITASIARKLLKTYQRDVSAAENHTEKEKKYQTQLTERETEVLGCMAKGYSYKEAASMLGMSSHTVSSHIKSIYRKLEVNSRGEAVYEAIQLGIVNLS